MNNNVETNTTNQGVSAKQNMKSILFYAIGIVALIVCAIIAWKVFVFVGKVIIIPIVFLIGAIFLITLMVKAIKRKVT